MKKIILSFFLITATAYANTTEVLTCEFSEIENSGELYIAVDGLANDNTSPELNYTKFTDYDGDGAAFSFDGSEGLEWLYNLTLSGDGQSVEISAKGDLIFSLDSDGCDVGKIHLYGNSDFKYGYLSVNHRCSGPSYPPTYSKVKCSLKTVDQLQETSEVLKSSLLNETKNAWDNADVDATDKYSSAYKSQNNITSDMVYDSLNHTYVEHIDLNLFDVTNNISDDAFDLAQSLFTADPFIDGESLDDIGPLITLLTTIIERADQYTIYRASISGAFSGAHTSLIIVSNETNEAITLSAGYSE